MERNKKNYYYKVVAPFLLLLLLPTLAFAQVRVVDGDTLVIKGERVRLYGIDCPEAPSSRWQGQPGWIEALTALQALTQVAEPQCQGIDTDRYGRTVAECTVEGVSINALLVSGGWCMVYPRYCDRDECAEWKAMEAQAKKEKKGIWASEPTPPWKWRKGEGWE